MAVECEFQALTSAEAQEEIQAYEAQSHKPIKGRGWPKATKSSSPGFVKALMGLHYSPGEFCQRRDECDQVPRWVTLDQNNSISGQQLPRSRCRISHGGKMLTSWDIIQRTASWTLFLSLQCPPPKPVLLGKDKTRSRREPLTLSESKDHAPKIE